MANERDYRLSFEIIADLRAELDAISGLIWAYGPAENLDPDRAKHLLTIAQKWIKERDGGENEGP